MVRVGGREVVYVSTFVVPSGEEVDLEFSAGGVDAKFRIKFLEDSDSKGEVSLAASPDPEVKDGDGGLLIFTNWNQKTRVATAEPVSIMEFNSFDIWVLVSVVYADNKYLATFQFMKGEKE